MKILVTGAHGLLGRSLLRERVAAELIGCGRGADPVGSGAYYQIDLLDVPAVGQLLGEIRPDWVVHTAAMTNVDRCETDRTEARSANLEVVESLVAACAESDSGLVQLSTDYVFDGADGPYGEEDEPCPLSHYGELKLMSESLVLGSGIKGCVLRTLWLYGYRPEARPNLVTWPLAALARGEDLRMVDDQWGNPTFVGDVVRALLTLCERRVTGLFHLGGADLMTRYELVCQLARSFGLNAGAVKSMSTVQADQKARRPMRSGLRSDRIAALGVGTSSLEEGLDQLKSEEEFCRDFSTQLEHRS